MVAAILTKPVTAHIVTRVEKCNWKWFMFFLLSMTWTEQERVLTYKARFSVCSYTDDIIKYISDLWKNERKSNKVQGDVIFSSVNISAVTTLVF